MSAPGSAFQGFQRHPPAGQATEKVKFTVSVHGHQWSSARHVHETLQEFARVIERNARRLEFIAQGEGIQRLQLVRPDGSEPEELDVDATLEDVLICMGEKQLVAMITSGGVTAKEDGGDEGPASISAPQEAPRTKTFFPKNETPTSYSMTPTSADESTPGCSKASPPSFGGLPLRGLKISIPCCDYSPDDADCRQAKPNGNYAPGGFSGMMNSNPITPSPAELAQFLVRSSSASRPSSNAPLIPNAPAAAFRPFPANAPAPNIALLAQFLAAQLRAFTPAQNSQQQQQQQPFEAFPPLGKAAADELAASSLQRAGPAPKPGLANAKASNKQPKTDDKDASSSSANASNPSPQCADTNDASKGRSELVFLVNRRSKVGVGTHHLILSDLSAYFHLSIVDAAKKLGVSQTTLKKACRKFGLKRWPGRKVRSLESTIHGLEHTIAVGQGAGMEELTEAYMRSEVLKLQQEMEQLVHGIPAAQQHLPMVKTADLYKRLYSRGWRSKLHGPCAGQCDLDLNASCKGGDTGKNNEQQPKSNQERISPRNHAEDHRKMEDPLPTPVGREDLEDQPREPTPKRPKVEEVKVDTKLRH